MCVRARMWVPGRVGVCERVRAYSLANLACNAFAPFCDVICGPSVSTAFFDISWTVRFSEKHYWTSNVCFDFLYNLCLKHFSFWAKLSEISSDMSRRLHVKYPLFLSAFNETWIFSTDFSKKRPNIRFHQNPSSGSRRVSCGQTDMTKLVVTFRNFANAPKHGRPPKHKSMVRLRLKSSTRTELCEIWSLYSRFGSPGLLL
jgi:hypothetical protein